MMDIHPSEFTTEWVLRMPDDVADGLLVDLVQHEMREKLKKKRDEGRCGWFGPNIQSHDLKKMLIDHIEKGDMVDVINFAAMILARKRLYRESLNSGEVKP
jgi:hypothetical protein